MNERMREWLNGVNGSTLMGKLQHFNDVYVHFYASWFPVQFAVVSNVFSTLLLYIVRFELFPDLVCYNDDLDLYAPTTPPHPNTRTSPPIRCEVEVTTSKNNFNVTQRSSIAP